MVTGNSRDVCTYLQRYETKPHSLYRHKSAYQQLCPLFTPSAKEGYCIGWEDEVLQGCNKWNGVGFDLSGQPHAYYSGVVLNHNSERTERMPVDSWNGGLTHPLAS